MKIIKYILILLMISQVSFGEDKKKKKNDLFGIKFDSVVIYILATDGGSGSYTLFSKDGKILKNLIKYQRKLKDYEVEWLSSVMKDIPKADEGTEDWRHVPFALVLFSNEKHVLQIFPNLVGNDVFTVPATPVNGHGLTKKAYAHLSSLYFTTVKLIQMEQRRKK